MSVYTSEQLRALTYDDGAAKIYEEVSNLRNLHELLPEILELSERFITAFEAGEDLTEISDLIRNSPPLVLVGVWGQCSKGTLKMSLVGAAHRVCIDNLLRFFKPKS